MRASGIVKRLVKSRTKAFTLCEINRSGGLRKIKTKAAKNPNEDRNGLAVAQFTVALLQFLSAEFAVAFWLASSEKTWCTTPQSLQRS